MGILDKITHPKPNHPAQHAPEPSGPPVQAARGAEQEQGTSSHQVDEMDMRDRARVAPETRTTAGRSAAGTTAGGTASAGNVEGGGGGGKYPAGEEEMMAGKAMAESANNFPGTNPHPAHSALGGQGLSMSGRE